MPSLVPARLRGNRDFTRLWAIASAGELGDQVSLLALPTLAILGLGAGPGIAGLLQTLRMLPALLFSMVSGAIADRARDRRRLLLWANFVVVVTALSVPVAAAMAHVTIVQLAIVILVAGAAAQLFDVTFYSVLPGIVPRDALPEANARFESTRVVAQLSGPGMAGLLIQLVGAARTVAGNSVALLAATPFMLRLQVARTPAHVERAGFLETLRGGAVFVFGDRRLRRCALASATSNLGGGIATAVLLVFLYRRAGLSPAEVGLIASTTGVIAPLIALNAPAVTRRVGLGFTLAAGAVFLGAAWVILPLATGALTVPVVVLSFFLSGIENGLWNVSMLTLRQLFTPDAMFGRMVASTRTVAQGTAPIGAAIGGVLGATAGLTPALVIAGVITASAGVFLFDRELWRAGVSAPPPQRL